jgi:hypothetical protein
MPVLDAELGSMHSDPRTHMPDGRTGKWILTDWTAADLHDKTVEFRIWLAEKSGTVPFHGLGHFDVTEVADKTLNPHGEKRIDIVVERWFGTHGATTRFFVPQEAASAIRKNPSGSNYDFSLFQF